MLNIKFFTLSFDSIHIPPPTSQVHMTPQIIFSLTYSPFPLNHYPHCDNLPYHPNLSVNYYTTDYDCTVIYSCLDDDIHMIQNLGHRVLLAKCEIKTAFRLLRLAPSEFDNTGMQI